MKTLHSGIIGLALVAGAPVAQGDVITDWNQTAIEVMKAANVAGNPWTRSMAMMNVAMYDAVNSVQARYTRFAATVPVAPRASAELSRKLYRILRPASSTDRFRLRAYPLTSALSTTIRR